MTPQQLEVELAAVIDPVLASQILQSYQEMQQRHYSGDWGPSELDGGKFCEVAARALLQLDTGIVSTKLPGDICSQLRDKSLPHLLSEKERDHFCRVLQMTYKLRSDRGVAHISTSAALTANHIDAMLVVANVKWLFAELLRLARGLDRSTVASIIEAIVQLEHPIIHELDGKPLVLSTSLSTPEEILLLLQHAPGGRLSTSQVRQYIPATPQAIGIAIRRLRDSRQIRLSDSGDIVITPSGMQRVQMEIIPKARAGDSSAEQTARRGRRTTPHARAGSKNNHKISG